MELTFQVNDEHIAVFDRSEDHQGNLVLPKDNNFIFSTSGSVLSSTELKEITTMLDWLNRGQ